MIKINLLPIKKKPPKKVIDLQQQLILAVLVLILVGIGMFFFWKSQKDRIDELQNEKVAAERHLQEQDVILKEVKNVEEDKKKVADKIAVIEQLKKNQAGPVRLLDEISKALPRSVNLTVLTEVKDKISLEGAGVTNEDVVRFVDNLKASQFFAEVTLLETSLATVGGTEYYKYKLQFIYKGL